MELENQFKYLVGAYFGIRSMDNYDLKVYVLKDIKDYIESFIEQYPIPNYPYQEIAEEIDKTLPLKRKLQDSLLVLPKVNAPMELVLLVKRKIKEIQEEERQQIIK